MKRSYVDTIRVTGSKARTKRLCAGVLMMPCWIGRNGGTHAKREGDGMSPVGRFRILRGWWRQDRRLPPRTGLAMRPTRKNNGWCDAPAHRCYNRLVPLPFPASFEEMWRADHQYDVVLEIDWNVKPRISGRGSAIFLHLMATNPGGTAGCVAVAPARIDRLMARIGRRTYIEIG